jgi:hypothetical protein
MNAMNTTSSLVLGLGGVGGLVARELRERLRGTPQAHTTRFLFLDAPGPNGPPGSLSNPGHPVIDSVPLSMEVLREVLEGVQDWSTYLPWLPRFDRAQLLEELRPYGTAGYRCLGRLTLFRAAEVIDRTLRRHLHSLREAAPVGYTDAILIAGASGGLGSSLLADLTFLLLRLAGTRTRTACLVLPPAGEVSRRRFQANTFATLCEMFSLKTRRENWNTQFENLLPTEIKPQTAEPWQRFYLFQAGLNEQPPYVDTARRVAEALALQFNPEIANPRHQTAQDLTTFEAQPHLLSPRADTGFSTCYGTTLDFLSLEQAPSTTTRQGTTVPVIDRFLLDEAARLFLAACEADFAELQAAVYQRRKKELAELHGDLAARESVLLRAVREPADEGGETAPGIDLDPMFVQKLPGAERALRWLWSEMRKPSPSLPAELPASAAAGNLLPARQHLADLKELREDSTAIWKNASVQIPPPAEGKSPRRRFLFPRLQRNMLWNLTQRIASAQALLRSPELREALYTAFPEILIEWQERLKPPEDAESPPPNPSLEEWFRQLEGHLENVARGVFSSSAPQAERRQFAFVLLPKKTPPHVDRKALKTKIQEIFTEKLQCPCQTFDLDDENGSVAHLYYEDLFRSPKEIRYLLDFRAAYLAEPRKEILHSDHRFVEKDLCSQFGGEVEAPLFCGNPGCEENVRSAPGGTTFCLGCRNPIRSRCGNPGCKIRDLHARAEAHNRTCPECGGLNHAAWWACCEHGKIAVFVPIDKERCPECIRQHHEDPVRFQASRISIRPDLRTRRACWHCENLAGENPEHQVFTIPEELNEFVRNGVNGHDRIRFLELAKKQRLGEDCKCPNCGTWLIPVDHRKKSAE